MSRRQVPPREPERDLPRGGGMHMTKHAKARPSNSDLFSGRHFRRVSGATK